MLYGYARVSTAFEKAKDRNQTFERQEMILKQAGVQLKNIFQDRIGGGTNTDDRAEYRKLMEVIMPGDMIYVSEMSRFSRSLQDLIASVNYLMEKQVGIKFIKEGLEIGSNGLSPMNKFIFQLFGAFNEFEKSLIAERVSQGMQASKRKGTILGRPKKYDAEMEASIIHDYVEEGFTYDELKEKYNLSRVTLINICKSHSKEKNKRYLALKRAEKQKTKFD